jgi:pyrimidine-specific ribonucleoside hydrolase
MNATDLMAATLADHAGLTILTLGPLTNLADALQGAPELADRIGSVYVMGGAIDVPGNVAGSDAEAPENEAAEWNAFVDPTALAAVLDAGLGSRLVSLDGTNQMPVTERLGRHVAAAVEASDAVAIHFVNELAAANPFMSSGDYYLWDPLAAIAAARYPAGTFSPVRLIVDVEEGPTSGATVRAEGEPNAEYLDQVDTPVVESIFVEVLSAE